MKLLLPRILLSKGCSDDKCAISIRATAPNSMWISAPQKSTLLACSTVSPALATHLLPFLLLFWHAKKAQEDVLLSLFPKYFISSRQVILNDTTVAQLVGGWVGGWVNSPQGVATPSALCFLGENLILLDTIYRTIHTPEQSSSLFSQCQQNKRQNNVRIAASARES